MLFLQEQPAREVKISLWVEYANKVINDYFGIVTSFDVLICHVKMGDGSASHIQKKSVYILNI